LLEHLGSRLWSSFARRLWPLVLPLAGVIFAATAWAAADPPSEAAVHANSEDSAAQRELAATEFTDQILSRANSSAAGRQEEVLVSFTRGLAISEALAAIQTSGPNVRLVAAMLYSEDALGMEHAIAVLVRPEDDAGTKIATFVAGFANAAREEAIAKLACDKGPSGSCEPLDQRVVASLSAIRDLDPSSYRVFGVTIQGDVASIATLLGHQAGAIKGVEPSLGSPFRAPLVTPATEAN